MRKKVRGAAAPHRGSPKHGQRSEFEPGNPAALADALRHLFTDRSIASAIGQRAQTQVRQRYSFERMVQSFEDLYLASLPARSLAGAQRAQAAGL